MWLYRVIDLNPADSWRMLWFPSVHLPPNIWYYIHPNIKSPPHWHMNLNQQKHSVLQRPTCTRDRPLTELTIPSSYHYTWVQTARTLLVQVRSLCKQMPQMNCYIWSLRKSKCFCVISMPLFLLVPCHHPLCMYILPPLIVMYLYWWWLIIDVYITYILSLSLKSVPNRTTWYIK